MNKRAQELVGLIHSTFLLAGRPTSTNKREGYSSGSVVLNYIMTGNENVAFVKGRIYEIFGPEGSGKTTLTLHLIAQAQAKGGVAAFIDVEHALDPVYARSIGVKDDELIISQPDSGEQALVVAEDAITKGADVVVIDSVAALVPQAELEGQIGDSHIGLQARLMSQALRKLTGLVSRKGAILIFTNQIRMKIGVVFGSPETTSGGNALKFYASVRIDVRSHRLDKIVLGGAKKKDAISEEEGGLILVKVVKNKLYPPFKSTKIKIVYGKGIDFTYSVLSFASVFGVVTDLTSKTYKYKGKEHKITGVGDDELKAIYKEAKAIMAKS